MALGGNPLPRPPAQLQHSGPDGQPLPAGGHNRVFIYQSLEHAQKAYAALPGDNNVGVFLPSNGFEVGSSDPRAHPDYDPNDPHWREHALALGGPGDDECENVPPPIESGPVIGTMAEAEPEILPSADDIESLSDAELLRLAARHNIKVAR